MFTGQAERKRAVRYCSFKEREYVITWRNGVTIPMRATDKNRVTSYIAAYEQFQQDRFSFLTGAVFS